MPLLVIDNRNKWAQFISKWNWAQFLTLAKLQFACKQFTSCPVASLKILVTMPASSLQAALNNWDDLEDCINEDIFLNKKKIRTIKEIYQPCTVPCLPVPRSHQRFYCGKGPNNVGKTHRSFRIFQRNIGKFEYRSRTLCALLCMPLARHVEQLKTSLM